VPPEQQLRVLLTQVIYSVRSERQLTIELNYNLLFRGFVGEVAPRGVSEDATWER
jgi:transposase